MQWLLALETDDDPISICRLMNVFRRKGVNLVTLSLAARARGFSVMALVETSETEVEHLFNFLRRSAGVEHVTCYLPVSAQAAGSDDLPGRPACVSLRFDHSGAGICASDPRKGHSASGAVGIGGVTISFLGHAAFHFQNGLPGKNRNPREGLLQYGQGLLRDRR